MTKHIKFLKGMSDFSCLILYIVAKNECNALNKYVKINCNLKNFQNSQLQIENKIKELSSKNNV